MEQDSKKMVYGSPEFVITQVQDVINENIKLTKADINNCNT